MLMCPSDGLSHQILTGGLKRQGRLLLSFSGEQRVPRGIEPQQGVLNSQPLGTVRYELQLLEMIGCCICAVH